MKVEWKPLEFSNVEHLWRIEERGGFTHAQTACGLTTTAKYAGSYRVRKIRHEKKPRNEMWTRCKNCLRAIEK